MSDSTVILAPGITPPYTTGVGRIDIGVLNNIGSVPGLAFWGRGNNVNAAPGGGFAFQLNDLRSGSTRTLRQPTGQTGTLTARTDLGYLGNRRTVEANSGADTRLDLSDATLLPTTGAWALYFAVHAQTALCRLFGGVGSSFGGNLVNAEIRLQVASSGSGAQVTANVSGGNVANRDLLVGFLRRTESGSNRLVIRHKFAGQAWVETAAAAFCTTDGLSTGALRTIPAALSVGVYAAAGGYSLQSRLGQVMLFNADLSAGNQTIVEDYLTNYHGMN